MPYANEFGQRLEPYTVQELRHERAVLVLALLDLMVSAVDHTTPPDVVNALAHTHVHATLLRESVQGDKPAERGYEWEEDSA